MVLIHIAILDRDVLLENVVSELKINSIVIVRDEIVGEEVNVVRQVESVLTLVIAKTVEVIFETAIYIN